MHFNIPFITIKRNAREGFRVATLIPGFLKNDLTNLQHVRLSAWLRKCEGNRQLFSELTDPTCLEEMLIRLRSFNHQRAWDKLLLQMPLSVLADTSPDIPPDLPLELMEPGCLALP